MRTLWVDLNVQDRKEYGRWAGNMEFQTTMVIYPESIVVTGKFLTSSALPWRRVQFIEPVPPGNSFIIDR